MHSPQQLCGFWWRSSESGYALAACRQTNLYKSATTYSPIHYSTHLSATRSKLCSLNLRAKLHECCPSLIVRGLNKANCIAWSHLPHLPQVCLNHDGGHFVASGCLMFRQQDHWVPVWRQLHCSARTPFRHLLATGQWAVVQPF